MLSQLEPKRVKNRVVRFAYTSNETHGDREVLPYQLRDGDPALEFFDTLSLAGFAYGSVFINWPLRRGEQDTSLEAFRVLDMKDSDLLLLTTRPPISDHLKKMIVGKNGTTRAQEIKKPLRKSGTALEKKLFTGLEQIGLEECDRDHVKMSPEIARRFENGYQNRAEALYYSTRRKGRSQQDTMFDAAYKELHGIGGHSLTAASRRRRSAGYLVHLPLPGLPRLLAIWGASGMLTFLWSYLLGTKHTEVLEWALADPKQARLVMAEIEMSTRIPEKPTTMQFCQEWHVRFAARCDIDTANGCSD